MSRLSIELTPEQHQQIKAIAALQGTSIREYVLQRILPAEQAEVEALEELRDFLAPRIASAQAGNIVQTSAEAVFKKTLSEQ